MERTFNQETQKTIPAPYHLHQLKIFNIYTVHTTFRRKATIPPCSYKNTNDAVSKVAIQLNGNPPERLQRRLQQNRPDQFKTCLWVSNGVLVLQFVTLLYEIIIWFSLYFGGLFSGWSWSQVNEIFIFSNLVTMYKILLMFRIYVHFDLLWCILYMYLSMCHLICRQFTCSLFTVIWNTINQGPPATTDGCQSCC